MVIRSGTEKISDIDVETVIGMMVGRRSQKICTENPAAPLDRLLLEAQNITSPRHFENVSFKIQAGEILGMAGLVTALGAVMSVWPCLVPIRFPKAKSWWMEKVFICILPRAAMAMGIAYLSENRQGDSLFFGMDIKKNVVVSLLEKLSAFGFIDRAKEYSTAKEYVQKLNVQTPSLEQKIIKLSGGDQAKSCPGTLAGNQAPSANGG